MRETVLGLECRRDDDAVAGLLTGVNDEKTMREATAERVMPHSPRGHCDSPIGDLTRAPGRAPLWPHPYQDSGPTDGGLQVSSI
ncbi:hypothetical protein ACFV0Y_19480 [Streptomyces sp. NPDC059569]|uniref:hypothetical protein n=1 Tax=Streptomyces sp. NPDC059569 TaxID=3346869 RepID=UPI00367C6353